MAKVVEAAMQLSALLGVEEEGVKMNGATGFRKLEAVPVVPETKPFLDYNSKPSLCALDEKFVEDGGVHKKNSMHRNLIEQSGKRSQKEKNKDNKDKANFVLWAPPVEQVDCLVECGDG